MHCEVRLWDSHGNNGVDHHLVLNTTGSLPLWFRQTFLKAFHYYCRFTCLKKNKSVWKSKQSVWKKKNGKATLPGPQALNWGLLGEKLLCLWTRRLDRFPGHWINRTSGLVGPCLEQQRQHLTSASGSGPEKRIFSHQSQRFSGVATGEVRRITACQHALETQRIWFYTREPTGETRSWLYALKVWVKIIS